MVLCWLENPVSCRTPGDHTKLLPGNPSLKVVLNPSHRDNPTICTCTEQANCNL